MQRITDSVINDAINQDNSVSKLQSILNVSKSTASKQKARFDKKRHMLNLSGMIFSGICMLSLPVQSYTSINSNEKYSSFQNVVTQKQLTLASVKGDSTYFAIDGFEHGFGYDLARNYANELGVTLNLKTYETSEAALNAVKAGEADMALTTASTKLKSDLSLSSVNLSCGRDAKLTLNGLHPKVSWSFLNSEDNLAKSASHYLCNNMQIKHTEKLARFYNQNLLRDAYNKMHFKKAMNERLPSYKSSFQTVAEKYDHDWELLVAMGYQESHLREDAISPTGVQGLMMLTQDTAKAMGINNRVDPTQSIHGGARYLEMMKETFSDVPKTDRTFFALASYNMGPYAVKRIQSELRTQGKNDKSWTNVYAYMSDNAQENSRYMQCMHYVSNIRSYLETIKMQTV